MFKRLGMFDRSLGMFQPLGKFAAVFTPAELFASGEQGTWYDPSDWTTLFQDSAGTTPVTAVEQPVGLMLDKSQGLALGPELVTNGNFSDGNADWTQTGSGAGFATITYSNALRAEIVDPNISVTYVVYQEYSGLVVGKSYQISLSANSLRSNPSATSFGLKILDTDLGYGSAYISGQKSWIFTAASTTVRLFELYMRRYATGTAGDFVEFDNISVKELTGNHATQPTSAARPILSARYNLLTYTEDFSNAVWQKLKGGTGVTPVVTKNAGTAPDGTLTANRVVCERGGGNTASDYSFLLSPTGGGSAGTVWKGSVYIKSNTVSSQTVLVYVVGSVTYQKATVTVDSAWTRISPADYTSDVANAYIVFGTRGSATWGGDQSLDILAWGADLRVANDGVGIPSYQRVGAAVTATTNPAVTGVPDYDTTGFPLYLRFDGVDDCLYTSSINFTATDKMTVWAGVRKLSDSAAGYLFELSASAASNAGTFSCAMPATDGTFTYFWRSRGTGSGGSSATAGDYPAPITSVLAGIGDISNDISRLRYNGGLILDIVTDQGTGNYGNYPLYIGRRNNASLQFNGRIYSLCIRGAQSSETQITQTETWVNSKTKAY